MSKNIQGFRVLVLISGRGSNLQAIVNYFRESHAGIVVCGVVSDRPTAAGLQFAAAENIPTSVFTRRPKELTLQEYNEQLAQVCASFKPDLIALAGFMRVLEKEFINNFSGRIVNIHPSLLPAFRGLNAQSQALNAGVTIAGCTVHFVVPEVDAGPVICQGVAAIEPDDDEHSLANRILELEHYLYPRAIEAIAKKDVGLESNRTGAQKVIRKNSPTFAVSHSNLKRM